jgi:hypothetical protein
MCRGVTVCRVIADCGVVLCVVFGNNADADSAPPLSLLFSFRLRTCRQSFFHTGLFIGAAEGDRGEQRRSHHGWPSHLHSQTHRLSLLTSMSVPQKLALELELVLG